ncbi:hypothetical protein [Streptomyces sp. CA-111067]|uniref:hypothetical protein n=1 Tax=Streptomyces sp. CA-111067 TaxID=3240046 RepID=UPI003D960AB0
MQRDQVVLNALGFWHEYSAILNLMGRYEAGALVLSAFALRDGWTPEDITSYDRSPRPYSQAQGAMLLDRGLELWPTSTTTPDGEPDPRNEVHYDVVVTTDSTLVPDEVLTGTKEEKKRGRARLRSVFDPILDLWET